MKLALSGATLIFLILIAGCGAAEDPILDTLYTRDVLPGTASTYNIGSVDYPFNTGWVDDLTVMNSFTANEISITAGLEIREDGTIKLIEMSNTIALPESLYFSTENSTLVYKDSFGVVHVLD